MEAADVGAVAAPADSVAVADPADPAAGTRPRTRFRLITDAISSLTQTRPTTDMTHKIRAVIRSEQS